MNFFPNFSSNTAYLLVIHGSRDPRPAEAVHHLAQQVEKSLGNSCLIETASLEFASIPLHQQIVACTHRALNQGCQTLKIFPLFLLPGVHVREDIPEEVALAQTALGDRLAIEILPYLGGCSGMSDVLAQRIARQMNHVPFSSNTGSIVPHVILMAHGSRRVGGRQLIESIASRLGATPAYWSVAPKLSDQLQSLSRKGHHHIIVMPYFLFEGGITDAIAHSVSLLNLETPATTIILGEVLGAKSDIVELVAQEIRQEQRNLVLSHNP